MARKRPLLLAPLPAVLKYFLLGISIILFILLSQGEVQLTEAYPLSLAAQPANLEETDHQHQAQTLTKMGHEQLSQGQTREALQTWQEANRIYRKLDHQEGITGSLVNQSLALQELGQYYRACTTLVESLHLEDWVCQNSSQMDNMPDNPEKLLINNIQARPEHSVRILALRSFGDVLRLIGKLDESKIVLEQALAMAKHLVPASDTNDILLSLGNTEQSLYRQERSRLQLSEDLMSGAQQIKLSQAKFKAALDLYQRVSNSSNKEQEGTGLQARLNSLSLLLDVERSKTDVDDWKIPSLSNLRAETRPQIKPLLEQLLTVQFTQLPASQSIYARLNFANSLMRIGQNVELKQLLFGDKNPFVLALQQAQDAVEIAQNLGNLRAKSYAFGTIGNIYTQIDSQPERSQQYFEKALGIAQSIQAWDIAYQWQQQLGKLFQQQGQLDRGIEAYQAAVNSLNQVRANILSIDAELQFSFREKVEPVYRDLIRLLLSKPNPDLQRVIGINEQFQAAELENFLRCGKLDLVSLNQLKNLPTVPTAIYILNLANRIEVIVQSPSKGLYHYSADAKLVTSNINDLLPNVQTPVFGEVDEKASKQIILSHSQQLYNSLIAPAKEKGYLPKEGTLIFILDSTLQSLPTSVLHDGQSYLFEHYSIAMTLGSQLREPKAMPANKSALIAGISRVNPIFKNSKTFKSITSLPEVEIEVESIKKNISSTVELLNENFTSKQFQAEMSRHNFPIIHITTHGKFSSDPKQTTLLSWDKLINVQQMNRLLRSKTEVGQELPELLVLSACETAKGDAQSALGIAGIAAQAGARSTVASLWVVEAESTALFMNEFYKSLKDGMPKAEAVRQAQLVLLKSPKFQHPFFWSPFILVGSWL